MANRFRKRIEELAEVERVLEGVRVDVLSLPVLYREDIAAELRDIAEMLEGKRPAASGDDAGGRETGGTVAHRMVAFFEKRGNKPAGIPEIADGASATTETVRSILYKPDRNKGQFVQASSWSGGSSGASMWKMAVGSPPLGEDHTQAPETDGE